MRASEFRVNVPKTKCQKPKTSQFEGALSKKLERTLCLLQVMTAIQLRTMQVWQDSNTGIRKQDPTTIHLYPSRYVRESRQRGHETIAKALDLATFMCPKCYVLKCRSNSMNLNPDTTLRNPYPLWHFNLPHHKAQRVPRAVLVDTFPGPCSL